MFSFKLEWHLTISCFNKCDPLRDSHDHHWLYPIPIAPLAWHHAEDSAYDLWTMLIRFPSLVSFLLPNMYCRGPTNHKSSHHMIGTLPSIFLHTNLVLILLIICIQDFCIYSKKEGSFSPELRLKFISSYHFASLCLSPLPYFTLSDYPEPSSHTTSHSLILHQETISLLSNHTPQSHIGYILRSPTPLIFVAS